jgi:hypothetical protein
MPVLSLCLLFMFVASFAFIISLIYSVIISLNPVEATNIKSKHNDNTGMDGWMGKFI